MPGLAGIVFISQHEIWRSSHRFIMKWKTGHLFIVLKSHSSEPSKQLTQLLTSSTITCSTRCPPVKHWRTTNTIDLDSQQFTRFLFTCAQFMLIMLTFFFNLGHLHLDYSTLMRIIQSISFLLLVIVRLCLTNNLDLSWLWFYGYYNNWMTVLRVVWQSYSEPLAFCCRFPNAQQYFNSKPKPSWFLLHIIKFWK